MHLIELPGDFNRSGATRAVTLDISKVCNRAWHAGLPHKFKSYGISGQIFGLISLFLSNRQLQGILDGESSQEHSVIKDAIKPLQLFIFTNVICCSRVPLWVDYFIYFKFRPPAFRILLVISPHFVWVSSKNFSFFIFLYFT